MYFKFSNLKPQTSNLKPQTSNLKPQTSNLKLSRLLSFFVLSVFLLMFINCEDTIAPEPEQQEEDVLEDVVPRVETMTYESVPQNFNKLKGHFKLSNHLEGDTQFSKDISNKNGIIIHTDVIKEVTLGDYKSYTMRITMPNAPSNKLFNLTVEEKNGEEGLFLTIYTSKSLTAKGGSVDAGSVVTRKYDDFETIPPYVDGESNDLSGGSAGGGATSGEATLEYPYNCNGDIIIQPGSVRVPYQCTCNDHWPWQGCDCPVYGGEAPGYNYVDGYLCVPYTDNWGAPDTNTNTGVGNTGTSGSVGNDDPSITVTVDDETPCDPAPPGDLNGDCKVERYEVCLNSLNNRLVSRLSEENFNALVNYLNKEGCGDNSGFINNAIEAWVNDGEVDFENELIIDKSFKDTKAHCVLKALVSSSNNIFKRTVEAFTDGKSKFKLKFTAKTDKSDFAPARTPFNPSGNIITIRFNLAVATDATLAIDLAGTILHESIHAELHRLKITNNSGPNPLPASLFNWYMQMWSYYEVKNNEKFEDPYDVLNKTASDSQHNLMAFRFIDPIASGLREFDEKLYSLEYYKFEAWSGLADYGKKAKYITKEELEELADLSIAIRDDNHKNPCD